MLCMWSLADPVLLLFLAAIPASCKNTCTVLLQQHLRCSCATDRYVLAASPRIICCC